MTPTRRRAARTIGAWLALLVAISLAVSGCSWSAGGNSAASATDTTGTTDPTLSAAPSSTPTGPTTIIVDLADAAVGKYGIRTKATFSVVAQGLKLRYTWQHRSPSGGAWKVIKGATSSHYTARARTWATGTRFRVVVKGADRTVTSSAAKLTVLLPTRTPAADAEKAFGLTGLTQGLDISGYQHTPAQKVNIAALASWAGKGGFTLMRNGSGARPIKQEYTSICTGKSHKTGAKPVVEDCAYAGFADAARSKKLKLGHYWFNGWIRSIDTTPKKVFSGNYTPEASARQFVDWLIKDGNYTKASTDPLVLDIEAGHAWTKKLDGKTFTRKLRAWNAKEATAWLTTVRELLTGRGYQANLYVYMSGNAADKQVLGVYKWADIAPLARLWVASWGTNNARIPEALPKVGPWAAFGGWSIWQYTSDAHVPGDGVNGLDGDIATADAWTPR